jgi:hypothetical protein
MKTACGQYLRPSDQGISRSVEAGQDLLIYEPTQGGLRVCQNAESGPPKINSLSGAPPCVRDRARRNGEPRPPSASLDLDTIASQLLEGLGIRAHQPVRAGIHDQVYPWFRVNLGNVIQDQSVSFCPRPIADPQVRLPTRPPRFAQGMVVTRSTRGIQRTLKFLRALAIQIHPLPEPSRSIASLGPDVATVAARGSAAEPAERVGRRRAVRGADHVLIQPAAGRCTRTTSTCEPNAASASRAGQPPLAIPVR